MGRHLASSLWRHRCRSGWRSCLHLLQLPHGQHPQLCVPFTPVVSCNSLQSDPLSLSQLAHTEANLGHIGVLGSCGREKAAQVLSLPGPHPPLTWPLSAISVLCEQHKFLLEKRGLSGFENARAAKRHPPTENAARVSADPCPRPRVLTQLPATAAPVSPEESEESTGKYCSCSGDTPMPKTLLQRSTKGYFSN